jgi:hypothetical protein
VLTAAIALLHDGSSTWTYLNNQNEAGYHEQKQTSHKSRRCLPICRIRFPWKSSSRSRSSRPQDGKIDIEPPPGVDLRPSGCEPRPISAGQALTS